MNAHRIPPSRAAALILLLSASALLGSIPEDAAELPRSPGELRGAVERAYRTHDLEALRKVVCWDGVDPATEAEWERIGWRIDGEVDSVSLEPSRGHAFLEFTNPEGVHFQKNLELLGRVVVGTSTPSPWVTRLDYGLRDRAYLLTWFAPVDTLPPPEQDPILARRALSRDERRLLDAYYAGSEAAKDTITEKVRYLSHPNPTAFLRAERFMLLMLRDALDPARPVQKARELRQEPVRWDLLPQGLDLARFYLDEEPDPEIQARAVGILDHLKTPAADSLILRLIEVPGNNALISEGALTLAKKRGIRPSREALIRLAGASDYRVSQMARELNDGLGGPPLEPGEAMDLRGRVRRLLAAVDSMAVGDLPPDAAFGELEALRVTADGDTARLRCHGWILGQDADSISFVTTDTGQMDLARADTAHAVINGRRTAMHIVGIREIPPESGIDSREGDSMWLFWEMPRPWQVTAHPLSIVRWLAANHEDSLLTERMTRLLHSYPTDEAFLQFARESYADAYAYRLLAFYAGDRDLAGTLPMARRAVRLYSGTPLGDVAARMCEEIPRRMDDFKGFRLPTPDEWETVRRERSRGDQIRFLCERLRLLNWFGYGEGRWSGSSEFDPQFAEATGIQRNRIERTLRVGATEVINPYRILLGMSVADLPVIARYLPDDWLTFGVTDGRVETTSKLLAEAINRIADQTLCDVWNWDGFTAAERKQQTQRVVRWAEENKNLTEQERLLKRVHEAKQWRDVPAYRFDRLTPSQREESLRDALRFIDPGADGFTRQQILWCCLRWNPAACLASATALLDAREPPKVQILAGLIVAGHGDRERGLDAVASALARDTYSTLSCSDALRGVEVLLTEGTESRYREAAVVFDRDYFNQGWDTERGQILERFARAYRPDPYRLLLAELADSTEQGSSSSGPIQRRDWAAQLAVRSLIPPETGYEYDFEAPAAIREENREKIRAWLTAKLAEMTGGD